MRILSASVLMLATAAVAAAPATEDDYPMRAQPVAPGVYAVISPARDFPSAENRGWNANSAFVVTGQGVLLVDTGSSEAIGRALRRTIATVTDRPVRWIVNTHGHGDHWLGNAAFADLAPEIIATTTVRERIARDGAMWVERFTAMTAGATGSSRIVAPTRVYDAPVAIDFGGRKAELIPSNDAHSPGDLIVWLPDAQVLIGGDVLYVERAPATFDARVQPWIATLRDLEARAPRHVIPGHGPVAGGAAVGRLRAYLEELWRVVASGYDAGQPDFEILPAARTAMARHRQYFPDLDTRLGESVSHVYLQVEALAFQ